MHFGTTELYLYSKLYIEFSVLVQEKVVRAVSRMQYIGLYSELDKARLDENDKRDVQLCVSNVYKVMIAVFFSINE